MTDRTVMVVEDDAAIRDAILEILESEGYEPFAVRNGAEALAVLRRGWVEPALILLDLMMPVMDGWQFREAQLRDPALAAIPVIVMSASDPAGISADARITKPIELDLLLATIARVATPDRDHGPGRTADRDHGAGCTPGVASGTCRSATEFMQ